MRNKTTSTSIRTKTKSEPKSKTKPQKPTPASTNPLRRHWRLLIPVLLMIAIFFLSAPPFPSLTSWTDSFSRIESFLLNSRVFLFVLLGASWYYYLRTLGRFTPAFTALACLLLPAIFSGVVEFFHPWSPDYQNFAFDIFAESGLAFLGAIIFAALYYATRTPSQKLARKKQVAQLWHDNDILAKKLKK